MALLKGFGWQAKEYRNVIPGGHMVTIRFLPKKEKTKPSLLINYCLLLFLTVFINGIINDFKDYKTSQ